MQLIFSRIFVVVLVVMAVITPPPSARAETHESATFKRLLAMQHTELDRLALQYLV